MSKTSTDRREMVGRASVGAVLVLALALAGACSEKDLLRVDSPTRIPAVSLENPANAPILLAGAIADFECAFGAYVVVGGLIGEELEDATQTANRYPYDQRTITPASDRYSTSACEAIGIYSPLQTARISLNNLRRLLAGWNDQEVPNRTLAIATATAYEGYTLVLFGEGFCSTVLSTFNADGTVSYGAEVTSPQVLDSAITRFTTAIQAAGDAGASGQSIRNLALVGRARARLDRGDLPGARADAAQVPPTFVFTASASNVQTRRQNRVWADNGVTGTGPITATSAINAGSSVGAAYRNLGDPRVVVENSGRTAAGTRVPIWIQRKYNDPAAPIRLASGDEAQLIVAEADLATNAANALAIVNAFRARGGQSALPAGTGAAELRAALIDQRRRALFLEGQHLGDLIRYNLPLSPAAGAAFPGGGTYGSQRCMPLPDVERLNNPQLQQPQS